MRKGRLVPGAGAVAIGSGLARHRLSLRAVGDDPGAADVTGPHALRIRCTCSMITGLLAGFAGAFLAIGVVARWQEGLTAGRGSVVRALLIVARWSPLLLGVNVAASVPTAAAGRRRRNPGANATPLALGRTFMRRRG